MDETLPQVVKESKQGKPFPKAFPMETRLKCVEDWLEYGNLKQAAERNDVAYPTIKMWKAEKWWKEFEDEILAQKRIGTQNKIGSIVDKGLDVVQERLENGDFYYDSAAKEVRRKPVTLRDAAAATNGLMARQSILEKQNSLFNNREQTKTITEHLALLASEFAKFNNKSKVNAVDVEFKEISNAYMKNGHRDYKRENALYNSRPSVVRKREMRNAARAELAKEGIVHKGDGKDVDHTKPLSTGGSTKRSNLRAVPASENRSFSRNSDGSLKSQVSKRERKHK